MCRAPPVPLCSCLGGNHPGSANQRRSWVALAQIDQGYWVYLCPKLGIHQHPEKVNAAGSWHSTQVLWRLLTIVDGLKKLLATLQDFELLDWQAVPARGLAKVWPRSGTRLALLLRLYMHLSVFYSAEIIWCLTYWQVTAKLRKNVIYYIFTRFYSLLIPFHMILLCNNEFSINQNFIWFWVFKWFNRIEVKNALLKSTWILQSPCIISKWSSPSSSCIMMFPADEWRSCLYIA